MAASTHRQSVGLNGYALRAIRIAKGLSAQQVADRTELAGRYVARSRIAQIESRTQGGKRNRVTPELLAAITEALGLEDTRALVADPYGDDGLAVAI